MCGQRWTIKAWRTRNGRGQPNRPALAGPRLRVHYFRRERLVPIIQLPASRLPARKRSRARSRWATSPGRLPQGPTRAEASATAPTTPWRRAPKVRERPHRRAMRTTRSKAHLGRTSHRAHSQGSRQQQGTMGTNQQQAGPAGVATEAEMAATEAAPAATTAWVTRSGQAPRLRAFSLAHGPTRHAAIVTQRQPATADSARPPLARHEPQEWHHDMNPNHRRHPRHSRNCSFLTDMGFDLVTRTPGRSGGNTNSDGRFRIVLMHLPARMRTEQRIQQFISQPIWRIAHRPWPGLLQTDFVRPEVSLVELPARPGGRGRGRGRGAAEPLHPGLAFITLAHEQVAAALLRANDTIRERGIGGRPIDIDIARSKQSSSGNQCYICYQEGHFARECVSAAACRRCRQTGHALGGRLH